MKKTLLFILLASICLLSITGQAQSFVNDASFGLYRNEKDAAFDVSEAQTGPVFTTLEFWYIFAGLTNWYNIPTEGTSSTNPFTLGLYSPGEKPWSVYSDFYLDITNGNRADGPETALTNAMTIGTTTYTYVTSVKDNDYTFHTESDLDLNALFLTTTGDLNWGIDASFSYENNKGNDTVNTWLDNNRTAVTTTNYNTAAAGSAPDMAENYTLTEVFKAPDYDLDMELRVPFYMVLDAYKLTSNTGLSWGIRDESTLSTETYSASANGPITFNNINAETSSKKVQLDFGLDTISTLTMAPLFGKHKDNRLDLGLNAGIDMYIPLERVEKTLVYDMESTAANSPLVITNYDTDKTTTTTLAPHVAWSLIPSATHYLYFQPAENVAFAFSPTVNLGIKYTTPETGYTTKVVEVVKDDADDDGAYDNAADTITTTTTETSGAKANDCHFDVVGGISIPSAFELKLEKLPFSMIFGTEIGMDYTLAIYSDRQNSTNTTTTVIDGTGVTTSNSTTIETEYENATRLDHTWNFKNAYSFTLLFDLPAEIKLAVNLNAANLLNFDNLSAELILPLK